MSKIDNRSLEWVLLFLCFTIMAFIQWLIVSDLRRVLETTKRIEQIQNDTRPHH